MSKTQKSDRAWRILKDLRWLKFMAMERLAEEVPDLEIDSVNVIEVGFQPLEEKCPIAEGDIIIWIHLAIYIDNVTIKQTEKLNRTGSITILNIDCPDKCQIKYRTAYTFEFWHGETGKAKLEDCFTNFDSED